MKKFQKTINGLKYQGKAFEEDDIIKKLGRSNNEWEIINQYQKTFPQLLIDDVEGFVVDAEILWNELDKPQGEYSKFAKRKIVDMFDFNVDYSRYDKLVGTIKNGNGKKVERHILTLETAKSIALGVGTDKKSSVEVRQKGNLVRKYFILIEKALKEMDKWIEVREPEKEGWNSMVFSLQNWCARRNHVMDDVFKSREANMINIALTGMDASEIRYITKAKDNITRDGLQAEVNQAISNLQFLNKSLLDSNMDFEVRKGIIETTCKTTYNHIKDLIG